MVSVRARYWMLAIGTFVVVRLVTGSPFLAFIAGSITCHFLSKEDAPW